MAAPIHVLWVGPLSTPVQGLLGILGYRHPRRWIEGIGRSPTQKSGPRLPP